MQHWSQETLIGGVRRWAKGGKVCYQRSYHSTRLERTPAGDPPEAGEHTLLSYPRQEWGSWGVCMPVSVTCCLKAASRGTDSPASLVCCAAYGVDLESRESPQRRHQSSVSWAAGAEQMGLAPHQMMMVAVSAITGLSPCLPTCFKSVSALCLVLRWHRWLRSSPVLRMLTVYWGNWDRQVTSNFEPVRFLLWYMVLNNMGLSWWLSG